MSELTLRRVLVNRTRELNAWQIGATGLLLLAALLNAATTAALMDARARLADQEVQLQLVEDSRDAAVREIRTLSLRMEQQAAAAPPEAREIQYASIGTCVVTSYCPCALCCGSWADGLTATGIPAEPGVVAVDPSVIPLGSTVVIDGREYLAADVGVTGHAVDICTAGHQEAAAYGVQTHEVWVSTP